MSKPSGPRTPPSKMGTGSNLFLAQDQQKREEYQARKQWYEARQKQRESGVDPEPDIPPHLASRLSVPQRSDSPRPIRIKNGPVGVVDKLEPVEAVRRTISILEPNNTSSPLDSAKPASESSTVEIPNSLQPSVPGDEDESAKAERDRVAERAQHLANELQLLKSRVQQRKQRNMFLEMEKKKQQELQEKKAWYEERKRVGETSPSSSTPPAATTQTQTVSETTSTAANPAPASTPTAALATGSPAPTSPEIFPAKKEAAPKRDEEKLRAMARERKAKMQQKQVSPRGSRTTKSPEAQPAPAAANTPVVTKTQEQPKPVKKDNEVLGKKTMLTSQKPLTPLERRLLEKKRLEEVAVKFKQRRTQAPRKELRPAYSFPGGTPPPHPKMRFRIMEPLTAGPCERIIGAASLWMLQEIKRKRDGQVSKKQKKVRDNYEEEIDEEEDEEDEEDDMWWDDDEEEEEIDPNELEDEIEEDEMKIRLLEDEIKRLKEQEMRQAKEELSRNSDGSKRDKKREELRLLEKELNELENREKKMDKNLKKLESSS